MATKGPVSERVTRSLNFGPRSTIAGAGSAGYGANDTESYHLIKQAWPIRFHYGLISPRCVFNNPGDDVGHGHARRSRATLELFFDCGR